MIFAYRESIARLSARMTRAASPLIEPDSTPRAGDFGNHVWLPGEIGLVHHAVPVDDRSIQRTDFMRENEDESPTGTSSRATSARAPSRLRCASEGMGCASDPDPTTRFVRRTLPRFTTGKHEHDQRTGQIFTQQHRGHDGHAGEKVGTELQADEPDNQARPLVWSRRRASTIRSGESTKEIPIKVAL